VTFLDVLPTRLSRETCPAAREKHEKGRARAYERRRRRGTEENYDLPARFESRPKFRNFGRSSFRFVVYPSIPVRDTRTDGIDQSSVLFDRVAPNSLPPRPLAASRIRRIKRIYRNVWPIRTIIKSWESIVRRDTTLIMDGP